MVKIICRSLLQETYEIEDLWYSDPCTSDKGHWTDTTALQFDSNGMKVNCASGHDTALNITYPSSDFSVECTIVEPNNPNDWTGAVHGFGTGVVCGNNSLRYWYDDNNGSYDTESNARFYANDKIKIVVENGSTKIYFNGTLKKTVNTMSNNPFELYCSPNINYCIKIKDLKVKAL